MDEALRSNRELWDAWTKIHVASDFYDVGSFRDGRRPIRVADYERDEFGSVEGKTLLHLQCHFGLDTLSWARLGASVTGVDFSSASIVAARELAGELGIPATFIRSDIYRLPEVLDSRFPEQSSVVVIEADRVEPVCRDAGVIGRRGPCA